MSTGLPLEEELRYLNNRWVDDYLEWLMDKEPGMARELFQKDKEKLRDNLVLKSRHAAELFGRLMDQGMRENEAEEWVYAEVLAPSTPRGAGNPLSSEEKDAIREWSDSLLHPQTETTE